MGPGPVFTEWMDFSLCPVAFPAAQSVTDLLYVAKPWLSPVFLALSLALSPCSRMFFFFFFLRGGISWTCLFHSASGWVSITIHLQCKQSPPCPSPCAPAPWLCLPLSLSKLLLDSLGLTRCFWLFQLACPLPVTGGLSASLSHLLPRLPAPSRAAAQFTHPTAGRLGARTSLHTSRT